ncbi:serine hydrolase domain-containing protein [Bailinhaonella thermotolerans]|uniref:Class A beta-lactamase-related serine hydrolase n=1 Tax=Bailinhaonella thermotolerans TaxID=1070861 RepID=A0A3A4BL73_9ACTN|nr:serine hydrolase domain-containing protein [Bailinhaonella thermotolerans]RJL31792.1 class A beta-lactamase-related serine hydrolase [Bailinhaonella thermotolerans]
MTRRAVAASLVTAALPVAACSPAPSSRTARPERSGPAGTAAPGSAGSGGASPYRSRSRAEEEARSLVAGGRPGAVVWRRDGDRVEVAAAGFADTRARTPMTAGHRMRIGSVTKTFTAVLVLRLAGEGRLRLSDRLGRLLPGVLPAADDVTVRDLLGHTSGIPDYLREPRLTDELFSGGHLKRRSPRSLVAYAAPGAGNAGPDRPESYSNTNYVLLGMIVERITGTSAGEHLRRTVTAPLGLASTALAERPVERGMARGYTRRVGGAMTDVTEVDPSIFWTAGGIVSTAGDVGRFYQALFAGRLLRPPELGALKGGLGAFHTSLPCGDAWQHSGYVLGYVAEALSTGDARRQAVILTNTEHGGPAVPQVGRLACLG